MAAKDTAAIVDLLERDAAALHFRISEFRIDTTERLDHAYLQRLFSEGMNRKGRNNFERGACQARVQHGAACERLPAYPFRSLQHRRQATWRLSGRLHAVAGQTLSRR